MKENLVTIRHPELGVESHVMKESVPVWVESGWEEVGPTFPAMNEESEEEASEEAVSSGDVAGEDLQSVFDFNEDDDPSEASEKE